MPELWTPTESKMDAEFKREFNRIYAAIAEMRKWQRQENWVTASALCKLTGWDANTLLMMRRNGLVQEKKRGKAVRYLLQSVPEVVFQQKKIN